MKTHRNATSRIITAIIACLFLQSTTNAECWYLELKYCSGISDPCENHDCTPVAPGIEVCKKQTGTKPSYGTYDRKRPVIGVESGEDSASTDYSSYTYCTLWQQCTNYDQFCDEVNYCVGGSWSNYGVPTYDDAYDIGANPCP